MPKPKPMTRPSSGLNGSTSGAGSQAGDLNGSSQGGGSGASRQHTEYIIGDGALSVGYQGITALNPSVRAPSVDIDNLQRVGKLGAGAQGIVNLFTDKSTQSQLYAVKMVPCTAAAAATNELRNYANESPYAVSLYNAFLRGGKLYLIMEYMDAGTLTDVVKHIPNQRMPLNHVAYVAKEMLTGLHMLHSKQMHVDSGDKARGIVHRDIKPDNVLLKRCGDVKLGDFGLATTTLTVGRATFVGTANYMAPERIQEAVYGTPSDIWSVGIVLAELMIGRHPFPCENFFDLLRVVTSGSQVVLPEDCGEAQAFIDACLMKEPEQRATAAQLLNSDFMVRYCGTPDENGLPYLQQARQNFSQFVVEVLGAPKTPLQSTPPNPQQMGEQQPSFDGAQ